MARTDRVSYTIRWSRIKIFLGISNELETCLGSGGGPHEYPRSLSSPKAEKFEFDFFLHFGGRDNGGTE